jgi:hypothetical protein
MSFTPRVPRNEDEEDELDMPVAQDVDTEVDEPIAPSTGLQRVARPLNRDGFAAGGVMDAPDLQTRMAANKIQAGIAPSQREIQRLVGRQRLESTPALQAGGEGMDAPDPTVRAAAAKMQLGMAPTQKEMRRLTERQRLEAEGQVRPDQDSLTDLLAGSRLDPRGTRREQEIAARREAIATERARKQAEAQATKEFNSKALRDFKANKKRYYYDPVTGRLTPLTDNEGRQLYHRSTEWEVGTDPQGRPAKVMTDQYGQRQFKRPTVVESPDPHDEFLYADMGDGESVPYMRIEEAAADKDISLAAVGLRALRRRNETSRREGLAPIKSVADAAKAEFDGAREQQAMLQAQFDDLSQKRAQISDQALKATQGGFMGFGGAPTPEALMAQQQAAQIDAQLAEITMAQAAIDAELKPGGRLARAKVLGDVGLRLATAQSVRDTYAEQEQQILNRLKLQKVDPESDPTYLENRKRLMEANRIVEGAEKERTRYETMFNGAAAVPVAPAAPAPVAEPEGGTIAQGAKALARGALAEGYYAGLEGATRTVDTTARAASVRAALGEEYQRLGGTLGELERAQMQSANPTRARMIEQVRGRMAEMEQAAETRIAEVEQRRGLLPVAEAIGEAREGVRETMPLSDSFQRSLGGQILTGLGQAVGTLPLYAIPGAGPGVTIGQLYQQGYDDAVASGADQAKAAQAGMANIPAAALDVIGDKLILGRILKAAKGRVTVGQVAQSVAASSASEGVTEGAQTAWQNVVASTLAGYDPNRAVDDEVIRSVLVGAAVGGIATGAGQAGASALNRQQPPAAPETPPATAPVEPAPVAPEPEAAAAPSTDVAPAPAPAITAADIPQRTPKEAEAEVRAAEAELAVAAEAPEVVAAEATGPRSNYTTTGLVFPTEKAAMENAEPGQAVRRTSGGNYEVVELKKPDLPPSSEVIDLPPELAALPAPSNEPTPTPEPPPAEAAPETAAPAPEPEAVAAPVSPPVDVEFTPSPEPPVSGSTEITPEAGIAKEAPAAPEAAAPTPAEDYARYQAIQREWADLRKAGITPNSDQIRTLWAENEEIKNRHGGMPPPEPISTVTQPPTLRENPPDTPRAEQSGPEGGQAEKQPWQMTRREYALWRRMAEDPSRKPVSAELEADVEKLWGPGHEVIVAEALRAGNDVPTDVLAQYPDIKSSPAARDYDAEEVASGTKYQYKLIKEGDLWTAKMRMVRPDGTTTEWDGPIGVGKARSRESVARNFSDKFPDAARASSDPEIKAAIDRKDAAAAKDEAARVEVAAINRAETERNDAYRAEVRAVPLKGKSKEIALNRVEKDGKEVSVPTPAMVYGDWAIHKVTIGKNSSYSVTHVPSGKLAQRKDTLAQAKEMVQAFIHADIDVSKPDLGSDKATLKRLAEVAIAVNTGQAPAWYGKDQGGAQPAVAPTEPAPTPAPAQMKAPQLRAELRAAGVDSVSGVPVDDANAAQLMAAVGKLRRGQLETKPELVTDKALKSLQATRKKKLDDMQGKAFAATEGVYRAAEIAALDIAILAVRAGRPIEQAVRLAVARFKARYPGATPEDVAKIQAEVQRAASGEDTKQIAKAAPTTKQSQFPKSAREVGLPVEDIDYETRNQNERLREARAMIAKDGAAKAEATIADRNAPLDNRIATAGELLVRKNEELANATPDKAPQILRDIQRIARSVPSTETGQGLAMFNRIYQMAGVGSSLEYVRQQTKKRVSKLGGKEAEDAAADAAKDLSGAKTKDEIEKAIERLKKKYTTKPVRKMLTALQQRVDKVPELNRIGALTRDDMIEIAGNELKLPGADAAKLKRIAEIANKINSAKTHAERSRAELELIDTMAIFKGYSKADIGMSLLTANILSGYTTQLANLTGTGMQAGMNLVLAAATNPTPARLKALADGLKLGVPLGFSEAKSIWKTGVATRDLQDKTGGTGNVLSRVDFARDFPWTGKVVGGAMTKTARAVEKVFRFMRAVDAVFYYSAREAYARLVATKLLEGKYSGKELADRVSAELHTTPQAFEIAKRQAEMEGYSGVDLGRRVADIIESKRSEGDVGKQAVKESEQFGAESTFTNEPVGWAGVAYHGLKYMAEEMRPGGIPILKPSLLFLKTPTNVFNEMMNWSPMGNMRAMRGMRGAGMFKPERRHFTADEARRLHIKGIIGTTMMATLIAQVLNDDDVDITATGPENTGELNQLKSGGWIPYSIKVGDTRISYKDTPLVLPLSIVGHVADAVRYKKSKTEMTLENEVANAVVQAPQVIFDMSMLTGMSNMMQWLAGRGGSGKAMVSSMGSIPANMVIPFNRLLQQIDQSFDSQSYKNNPLVGGIPLVRRMGEPMSDVQGRPRTYDPIRRFASEESSDRVDKLIRDKGIFIPEASDENKIGNKVMEPAQLDAFRRMSGQRIRVRILAMEPQFRAMTTEKAQNEIRRIAREERERVKPLIRAGMSK